MRHGNVAGHRATNIEAGLAMVPVFVVVVAAVEDAKCPQSGLAPAPAAGKDGCRREQGACRAGD